MESSLHQESLLWILSSHLELVFYYVESLFEKQKIFISMKPTLPVTAWIIPLVSCLKSQFQTLLDFFPTLCSRIATVLVSDPFCYFVSTVCLCLESVFHNAKLSQYYLSFAPRPFVLHVLCPPDENIIQMAKTYSWIKTYT